MSSSSITSSWRSQKKKNVYYREFFLAMTDNYLIENAIFNSNLAIIILWLSYIIKNYYKHLVSIIIVVIYLFNICFGLIQCHT